MKKTIALLLSLVTLLSLLAGCGENAPQTAGEPQSAAQSQVSLTTTLQGPTGKPLTEYTAGELDRKTLQDAVIRTALAYYYKGASVQYDISHPTEFSRTASGRRRLNCRNSPEMAAFDTAMYTSCSKYCFAVYHDAFDYEIPTYDKAWQNVYDMTPECEIVKVKFGEAHGSTGETDRAKAIEMLKAEIQPGDLIYASPKNDANNGHTMLYLGDYKGDGKQWVIHSWPVGGGVMNMTTGEDKREPDGALTIQTLEDLVLTEKGKPNYSVAREKIAFFYLIRVFDAPDFKDVKLTPSAVTRLEFPDLVVDKTADRYLYDDVLPDETVTVTEKITNRSKSDYGELTVVEFVPEGATLVSAEGAEVDGNMLTWKLKLAAGQAQDLVYTVQNQNPRGSLLQFPSGYAGMIPTRALKFKVGGERLTDEQKKALTDSIKNGFPEALKDGSLDLDAVNVFYREVLGMEIGLPKTFAELLQQCLGSEKFIGTETRVFVPTDDVTDANRTVKDMMVLGSIGGQFVDMDNASTQRIFDILPQYFEPGDVFVTSDVSTASVPLLDGRGTFYIYLGNARVLKYDNEGAKIVNFVDSVSCMMINSVFFALRPTMGYDKQVKVG